MIEDVYEYLTDPANLEVALELVPLVQQARLQVFERFWAGVAQDLDQRLQEDGSHERWRIDASSPVDMNYSWIAVRWRNDTAIWRFHVGVSCLTGKPGVEKGAYLKVGYGRPIEAKDRCEGDERLREALKREGFRQTKWTVAYKYLLDFGLPKFNIDSARDVLEISADNRGASLKAARVADLVWELFWSQQQVLEELNAANPYGESDGEAPQ